MFRVARPPMNTPVAWYFESCFGHWAVVLRQPLERDVFVRAREVECVEMVLVADDDDLVLVIDRHAVRRWDRVRALGSRCESRFGKRDR